MRLLALLLLLAPCFTRPVSAQSIPLRVVEDETGAPVFGALVVLEDPSGGVVRTVLTDETGRALMVGVAVGRYRLRAEMIGRTTAQSEEFSVAADQTVLRELRMSSSAIRLEGISVEAEGGRCSVRPAEGMLVSDVWVEARKALRAAAFTDASDVYRYRTTKYDRLVDRDTRAVREESLDRSASYGRAPFVSRPAEELLENGFVQSDSEGDLYYAPDASVLLSDAFLDTHCFRLERGDDEAAGLIGLGFDPVGDRKRVPDIAGTLWIDPETSQLEWLEYRYQNLNADLTSPQVGGRVDFRRLPNGTWIIPEWWIRMPVVGLTRDPSGRQRPYLEAYRVVGALITEVQESGGRTVLEAETGTVRGIVLDSLGVEGVRGARVGIVGSGQEVFTDAEGRFTIPSLVDGVYPIRFVHPSLEAIGASPVVETHEVRRGEVTSVRFRLPSQADVLFEACRDDERPEGTAVLLGWVRDARTSRPIPGATVQVRWGRYTILAQGTEDARLGPEVIEGFETVADDDGYYRFCAVPEDQLLSVVGRVQDRESPGDTLRIPEFAGARVLNVDVPREGR